VATPFGAMDVSDSPSERVCAEAVQVACRRSLAARGARIYITTVREAEGGVTPATRWEIGVADPSARRLHVSGFATRDDPVEKMATAAAEAAGQLSPSATDEGDCVVGDELVGHYERILIGRDLYDSWGERWTGDLPRPLWAVDGLWALEAVQGVKAARIGEEVEVRGERCTQYVGEACPAHVVGLTGIELVERQLVDDGFRRMLGRSPAVDGDRAVGLRPCRGYLSPSTAAQARAGSGNRSRARRPFQNRVGDLARGRTHRPD
jgi:hypothetical protein